ncbi:MAG: hypothetical protein IID44_08755 [Planctomycetes bacterium]|nr:hypothetical protein [Planctomycetota bacterium]
MKKIAAILVLLFPVALSASRSQAAGILNESFKLTAPGAWFGGSVSVRDGIAIIGAQFDNQGEHINAGSAYLFDISDGSQIGKFTASDASSGDAFGGAVAISGNFAVVGARFDDDTADASGSVYVFEVSSGREVFKLNASSAMKSDEFGISVAIDATTAIVGAWGDDEAGSSAGAAYLFNVLTGKQIAKLKVDDPKEEESLGKSVSISGATAIVGMPFNDDRCPANIACNSGSAYLFDANTGRQTSKLTAIDATKGDLFGWSVGISGDRAIVGAPYSDDACPLDGDCNSGSAYVFDIASGKQLAELTAPDAARYDSFGFAVAIDGDLAVVGVRGDDDMGNSSGSAYLFDVSTGQMIVKLLASDGAEGDVFGDSVAIRGKTVIVGAKLHGAANDGAAYIFHLPDLSADLTENVVVDFGDLTVLLANWNKPGATAGEGNLVDVNNSSIDFDDLTELLSQWTGPTLGETPQAGEAARPIPEPGSLYLMALGMAWLLNVGSRSRNLNG